jgi:hypothetical protein
MLDELIENIIKSGVRPLLMNIEDWQIICSDASQN